MSVNAGRERNTRFKVEWRISHTDSVWLPMSATMTLSEIDRENIRIGFKKYRKSEQ